MTGMMYYWGAYRECGIAYDTLHFVPCGVYTDDACYSRN